MSEKLISKKELLELTGISYGQLYRWKRKKLIPEEWFIKTATFTGQETFLPKDKVLERVEKIIELKDEVSLDELANMFSPNFNEVIIDEDRLIRENIISVGAMQLYKYNFGEKEKYNFYDTVVLNIFEMLITESNVKVQRSVEIIKRLKQIEKEINEKDYNLVMANIKECDEKMIFLYCGDVILLDDYNIVKKISINEKISEIKEKLI